MFAPLISAKSTLAWPLQARQRHSRAVPAFTAVSLILSPEETPPRGFSLRIQLQLWNCRCVR